MAASVSLFWMVLRDGSVETKHRHGSFEAAKREAERLARKCPGETFFVLACVGAALAPPSVTWLPASGPAGFCEELPW